MGIEFADVVPFMMRSLPGFHASEEQMKDADLAYIFKMHIVRYVSAESKSGSVLPLDEFAAVLEQLLTQGDENVYSLAVDTLEDFFEDPERERVSAHFGPKAKKIWRELSK
jgi:hypothetical protein